MEVSENSGGVQFEAPRGAVLTPEVDALLKGDEQGAAEAAMEQTSRRGGLVYFSSDPISIEDLGRT